MQSFVVNGSAGGRDKNAFILFAVVVGVDLLLGLLLGLLPGLWCVLVLCCLDGFCFGDSVDGDRVEVFDRDRRGDWA